MSTPERHPADSRQVSSRQTDRAYNELANRMSDGRLRRGDQLTAERQLCDELGVSRVTLRRAINRHRAEGSVYSMRGAGTFVTSPVLGEAPNNLLSFSKLSESRGLVPSAHLLHIDEHQSSIEEAEQCGIAPGVLVVSIHRLRFLDAMPVALSRSLVPSSCAPSVLHADWSTASLYGELALAGNPVVRADFAIEARPADQADAHLLHLAVGQPVLVTASTSYGSDGRILEIGNITYRGDRYRFRSTVYA